MTSIEVRNLTTSGTGDRPLLDDINLTVPSGETLALTGPSGAGKSLLLKTLIGLEEQTSGDILIDDVVVNTADPRRRDLAMVFQDYALHPHLDVFDNLAFAATLRRGYNRGELSERIHEVAELLALGELLDLKPVELDDAQRQRVALGRSLVRDARAYLLDAPFSQQSERVRTQVRSVTSQWQQENQRTSIFTTNDVAEALSTADRVAVMHQGFIHQVGTPRDLYERPADMFVAGYLGSPPMNLVPAFPMGRQLVMPLATMLLDDHLLERIGDRGVVVAGIRPEHCYDATGQGGQAVTDRVEFTTRIDDVEWRGSSQFAYLGYDIAPEVEELLNEVEDLLEFDLFQSFLVAELAAESSLRPGMSIRVVIPRQRVHVFDPETGENLTLAR
ncbi:ABC transporter ATP-binding protein [Aeromicrobium ginsengisoli]|uniref:ABC transporter ATP-binding protein n=1 Tax=Aeromicrobium ginsengisoli TaxID=363867 RepID=A0A5M4FJY3_9ACTN|nr:ABC transporter ATP-binding protein [Aeromicrobium ginsengisoli]KAA1400282.1 ABC transporter ATP-binding protein [Aeromicrobium ginsengisoli]